MRHGTPHRRQRHNNNPRGNGGGRRPFQQRTQVFDSNGPDVRIRGTAHQVAEKYQVLAKDAASSGDRVLAESYLQHAEHYQRLINSWGEENVQTPGMNRFVQNADRLDETPAEPSAPPEADLSLPASILGSFSHPVSEAGADMRTEDLTA